MRILPRPWRFISNHVTRETQHISGIFPQTQGVELQFPKEILCFPPKKDSGVEGGITRKKMVWNQYIFFCILSWNILIKYTNYKT